MREISTVSRVVLTFAICSVAALSSDVSYDNRAIKINGERKLIISGSIHYPRSTAEMWQSLVRKSKEGGLNAIETYVFWNAHEPEQRNYDFSGNLDLVRFIKTIQLEGLYAILRIGPYVCAEWTYGGFPVWLHNLPNIQMRTNNTVFQNEMKIFTTKIVDMMKQQRLFASQGGPIILAQIENEYGDVEWAYGQNGWSYLQWCADLANSFRVDIPWIMCKQDNAPLPLISTCNGFYCDQWQNPKADTTPTIWTENWSGWFKNWGGRDPHRPAEDVAFAVARFYQLGGTVQNYYMYHGGTNFGTNAGGPLITTSYDYDAPLDEYGNLNQPKWGHLKDLHKVLMSLEKMLTYGDRRDHDYGNLQYVTEYSYQGKRACFFANAQTDKDFNLNFDGKDYVVPAWSVSILPDCQTEAYSTAKVNVQTSIMVKKANDADNSGTLKWVWRPEKALHVDKHGSVEGITLVANQLLDQKRATNGTPCDYLWLLTTIQYDKKDHVWGKASNVTLQVHTKGHGLHAFLNGKHIGSQWDTNEFVFKSGSIKLKDGRNYLSLLSVTIGLANAGANFDRVEVGVHGPVKLIATTEVGETVETDISSNQWMYKTGLHGQDLGLHLVQSHHHHGWETKNLPTNRMLVWYSTTFPAPLGNDPVVVDLLGLGKGTAWVNGFNLGRYWPKSLAPEDGCDRQCNFRRSYNPGSSCSTNCGKPSQRWYHIPRSLLKDDDNVLVLFEEIGGELDLVNIQTVTVGTVCGNVYGGHILELSCQGERTFSQIEFASFGLPEGSCGDFKESTCHAANTVSIVKDACLGKKRCSLKVSEETFESMQCSTDPYKLAVQAVC